LVIVDATGNVAKRYDANGFYSSMAVGLTAGGGRLLWSGLSPLMTAPAGTNSGGLYAADACGTDAMNPALLPGTDPTCKAPVLVDTWSGGASGPLAADADGNAFAILSDFIANTQELRGFEHDAVAHGAPAAPGTTLFTLPGFTSELAADGSAAYAQPYDPM